MGTCNTAENTKRTNAHKMTERSEGGRCKCHEILQKNNTITINTTTQKEQINIKQVQDVNIKQVQDVPKQLNETIKQKKHINEIEITINASIREIDSGLCVNEGDTIEIKELPNYKWSFINNEKVNFIGHSNYSYLDIPIGALMLRISSEREVIHIDMLPFRKTFSKSGTLLFFANLDEDFLSTYKPCNELKVHISGNFGFVSPKYPFNEIEQYIPFEINDHNKAIEYLINKIRVNPKKFFIERILYARYIKKELLMEIDNLYSFSKQLPEVTISNELCLIAQEHSDKLEKSSLNGKLNPDDPEVKQKLPKIDYRCVIVYEYDDPFDIVVEMLNNRNNRDNILQGRFDLVGIGFQTHLIYKRITVILFGTNMS